MLIAGRPLEAWHKMRAALIASYLNPLSDLLHCANVHQRAVSSRQSCDNMPHTVVWVGWVEGGLASSRLEDRLSVG